MFKIINKYKKKVGKKMSKKWTLANAVKKFKPNKKESLNRNGGNLNTHEFNSLIKEMKCYYEVVTFEGKGRDRIIFTDKKRKVKAKKEDRRQFNKGAAPIHSKHLALMVMSRVGDIDYKARTRNGWATYFGLISPAEQDIMNGIYREEVLKPYKETMIRLGIMENGEEKTFQDLAYTLTKIVKGQLQTVLNQSEEMELISRISSWKGKVKGSNEPINIDKSLALEIKFIEEQLLKKHEISKKYSLMFKNCPKTKAFKAEWLGYIENVEDEEGTALHLQYIYEVFQIEVLNKYAFNEYITAHYPNEIDSFSLPENEQAYHFKLLDYVVDNAQKKHDRSLESKNKNLTMDEDTKELLAMFNMTENEAIAHIEKEEMQRELTSYEALLKSDKYVDCIRNLHIQLHGMSTTKSEEIKEEQRMIDEQMRKEFTQLLSNPTEVKQQESRALKEFVLENQEQQDIIIVDKSINEIPKYYNKNEYYEHTLMATIHDEKTFDAVIMELTRGVTVEEKIADFKHQLQCEKERERKEWDKLFEEGKPVKWELTTNNPLEVFHRIRDGRI